MIKKRTEQAHNDFGALFLKGKLSLDGKRQTLADAVIAKSGLVDDKQKASFDTSVKAFVKEKIEKSSETKMVAQEEQKSPAKP